MTPHPYALFNDDIFVVASFKRLLGWNVKSRDVIGQELLYYRTQ